jgi:excisionase family DNA binding protein
MDVAAAGIAVAAFAATVFVLAFALSNLQRGRPRSVEDTTGEGWMTVDEVAELLDVSPAEVVALAERDAIPYYLVSAGRPSDPRDLRFRRTEIEAWTIG